MEIETTSYLVIGAIFFSGCQGVEILSANEEGRIPFSPWGQIDSDPEDPGEPEDPKDPKNPGDEVSPGPVWGLPIPQDPSPEPPSGPSSLCPDGVLDNMTRTSSGAYSYNEIQVLPDQTKRYCIPLNDQTLFGQVPTTLTLSMDEVPDTECARVHARLEQAFAPHRSWEHEYTSHNFYIANVIVNPFWPSRSENACSDCVKPGTYVLTLSNAHAPSFPHGPPPKGEGPWQCYSWKTRWAWAKGAGH